MQGDVVQLDISLIHCHAMEDYILELQSKEKRKINNYTFYTWEYYISIEYRSSYSHTRPDKLGVSLGTSLSFYTHLNFTKTKWETQAT